MKWDFRHHLLMQIEMLRGDLSHEELSTRLGDVALPGALHRRKKAS